jgi:hypothetical protein
VISGRVHDVGQAQARMENIVYGYINLATSHNSAKSHDSIR